MRDLILNKVKDLCSDFLYYDRKEDEDLSPEQLRAVVASGEVSVDDMVQQFRECLEASLSEN